MGVNTSLAAKRKSFIDYCRRCNKNMRVYFSRPRMYCQKCQDKTVLEELDFSAPKGIEVDHDGVLIKPGAIEWQDVNKLTVIPKKFKFSLKACERCGARSYLPPKMKHCKDCQSNYTKQVLRTGKGVEIFKHRQLEDYGFAFPLAALVWIGGLVAVWFVK